MHLPRTTLLALALSSTVLFSTQATLAFELSSTDVQAQQFMPKAQEFQGFGCDGDNRSPELSWKDAPADTKSFAVTVYDPDAPTGSGWWHWLVYNIPANQHSLPANAGDPDSGLAPEGSMQHRNDYGSAAFGGACPPVGDKPHRYRFTVFALDVASLDVPTEGSAALLGYLLNQHSLGTAQLQAYYQR